jgi:THO complex subunit 4
MPPAPRGRNAFDTAVKPGSGRSLADRITRPRSASPRDSAGGPSRGRGGDSYVPGRNNSRSRSPPPRRREGGRRPGDRRGGGGGGGGGGRGPRGGSGTPRAGRDGRPRKTQDELDAEMANYFGGSKGGESAEPAANGPTAAAAAQDDDDIDMI